MVWRRWCGGGGDEVGDDNGDYDEGDATAPGGGAVLEAVTARVHREHHVQVLHHLGIEIFRI